METETTKLSPFHTNYGFTPSAYRPLRKGPNVDKARIKAELMVELHKELRAELEFVRKRMEYYVNKDRIEGPNL